MKRHYIVAALAACAFAGNVAAQTLKPGLWEVTSRMHSASGEMEKAMAAAQKEMASMPPEQRKQMEAMMGKQGMKMGAGSPGTTSMKVCMTPDMVERNELPVRDGNCRTTQHQRRGNTIKMSFACTQPPASGEGQYTIASPESYTMKMSITSPGAEKVSVSGSGRWVAADCGSVKPIQSPSSK